MTYSLLAQLMDVGGSRQLNYLQLSTLYTASHKLPSTECPVSLEGSQVQHLCQKTSFSS